MKALVQNEKILLRLSSTLTSAMDQIIAKKVPSLNRSEFIRRSVRYTLDHIEDFKGSEAATVSEKESVESVEKINAVREEFEQIMQYSERMKLEPNNTLSIKQLAHLMKLIATMIFKTNDPA